MSNTPVTTELSAQLSPGLLRSAIDSRIVKIRPSSTPLDQISRIAGGRACGSMKVEYYSVDLKKGCSTVKAKQSSKLLPRDEETSIPMDDVSIFSVSDTVLFPSVLNSIQEPLTAYVNSISGKNIGLIFTNLFTSDEQTECQLPDIPGKTVVVRMGRAASELDVQTPLYTSLPTKNYNLCQIFKAQIEESLLQRLADKEVGWTFTDQEEAAILDMRMCMERSFLFGNRGRLTLSGGNEVMLTGGIWKQATKSFAYTKGNLGNDQIISMMREAFSESNGSPRKILLAGSGLIEQLNKLEVNRVINAAQRVTKWGVDFDQIISKFGTLYVVRSEVFDLCDMADSGMIIDPEYITKYIHIPFSAERISFHKQGVRNTEGMVLTEASCLVLRYPDAHMRITAE